MKDFRKPLDDGLWDGTPGPPIPDCPHARATFCHLARVTHQVDSLQHQLNQLCAHDAEKEGDATRRTQISMAAARLIRLRAVEDTLDATLLLVVQLLRRRSSRCTDVTDPSPRTGNPSPHRPSPGTP